ncbi:MAG: hypothetical protein U9R75_09865 [Candidatus Thermoplasmatota archaeon]|nr:hypothetical protein [Candidatus Thermoplasmatota archaeon]
MERYFCIALGILLMLPMSLLDYGEGAEYEYQYFEVFQESNRTLTQNEEFFINLEYLSPGYNINYEWKQVMDHDSSFSFWISRDSISVYSESEINISSGDYFIEEYGHYSIHWTLMTEGQSENISYRVIVADAPDLSGIEIELGVDRTTEIRQMEIGIVPLTIKNRVGHGVTITGIEWNGSMMNRSSIGEFSEYIDDGSKKVFDLSIAVFGSSRLGDHDLEMNVTFDYLMNQTTYSGLWQVNIMEDCVRVFEKDTDHDGISDTADAFPLDPAASADLDGDQVPDAWNYGMDQSGSTTGLFLDAFPMDGAASVDSDWDGYPDSWNEGVDIENITTGLELDSFPEDPAAYLDADGDGYPDSWIEGYVVNDSTTGLTLDMFPGNGTEWKDSDSDGVGDNTDAFPEDPSASIDTDGDGYPDGWNEGMSGSDSTTGLKLDEFPDDADKWEKGSPALMILIIVAVILILLGGGAAAYFFVIRKKKGTSDEVDSS